MKRKIYIILFFLSFLIILDFCIPDFAMATVKRWYGKLNDDWNNPANWQGGALPTTGTTIIIDSNHYTGAKMDPRISSSSLFYPGSVTVINGGKVFYKQNH